MKSTQFSLGITLKLWKDSYPTTKKFNNKIIKKHEHRGNECEMASDSLPMNYFAGLFIFISCCYFSCNTFTCN